MSFRNAASSLSGERSDSLLVSALSRALSREAGIAHEAATTTSAAARLAMANDRIEPPRPKLAAAPQLHNVVSAVIWLDSASSALVRSRWMERSDRLAVASIR